MRNKLNLPLFCVLLFIFATPFGAGQVLAEDQPQNPPTPSKQATQAKIDELELRLKSFGEAETEQVAQALNITMEQLRERTEILRETQTYYNQQLQALQKYDSLVKEQQKLKDRIATGEALKLEEPPPYSLNFYDEYNARYADSKRNLATARLAVAMAEGGLREAQDRLAAAAARARLARDGEGKGKDQQEKLRNQWLAQQGEREEGLAMAALGYQELLLPSAQLEAELAATKADLARQVSERIRENLHFDQHDLDKQLANLDESRKELQDKADEIRRALRRVGREVLAAQGKVDSGVGTSGLAAAKAGLAVAEFWQQTYRIKLEQHESTLQQMGFRKQLWKQRYDLIKSAIKRVELLKLRDASVKQRDNLRQRVALEQERQTSLQLQIGKLEDRLRQENLKWGEKSNLSDQRQALMELLASTIDFLIVLNKTEQMNLQFMEELDRVLQTFSLAETVKVVLAKVQGWWNTELFVMDDQALTVRKIIIALGILIFGILIAGYFSSQLHKKLLASLRVSTSSAAITSKLTHYVVVLVVIFFAMRIVNIPLSAFAFAGGAIALGIGFGAQKLINNFISGFILMAEQPVKVGDLIMLEDKPGWIEDIGARSTRVRTYANTNILVPNSYFLENNIINWTHNDNVVRGQINVGVAYGSSTRKVKEALLRVAAAHGEVLKDPEPFVWFADFSDNALAFELYFWVTVTENFGIQTVSSDLRFMIDHEFRENNISIAFPQLDVHFDPAIIRIVETAAPERKGEPPPPGTGDSSSPLADQ